ncbi:MerR family transcriptional regulator [Deinococcus sp. Arct2-2]|uniref:MerR family transcriptional regulator n=1 Tax=Deinococcus sp. Arct2-2 TaxID=2568653 RepID=UPI0010A32CCB|nr:MerR family transcriptional regulator [Deinococcus sp. Arct2-2]THF71461.1 MerR family transcriptional regulator [Deinococcus sp. Arct2-2]
MLAGVELDIAGDWAGGIEQLVYEANRRLVYLLPEDRSGRPKDEVNARLVRHYTTLGLLSAPRREGREARYTRRHLLELLALRRLMADGLGGKVLMSALESRSEEELAALAMQGSDGLGGAGLGGTEVERAGSESRAGMQRRRQQATAPQTNRPQTDTGIMSFVDRLRKDAGLPPALPSPAPAPQADQREIVAYQSAPPPQFRPMLGITASPSPIPPHPRKPHTVTRLEVRRGLELQVRSTLAWPQTSGQWDALMQEIRASLLVLQRASKRTSTDDAGAGQTDNRPEQD